MSGPTWRKSQIEISQSGSDFGLWVSMRRAQNCMRRATLEVILWYFIKSKLSPSVIFTKPYLFTFQPKWNVSIWCQFSPPKLQSPKTTSCVSKQGQRGHSLSVFDLLRTQNLPKFIGHAPTIMIFHAKSKNIKFLKFGAL